MCPGGLISGRIERPSVAWRDRDAPASPNRSPGSREKVTSSTARTGPRGYSKATLKPSTCRTGPVIAEPSCAAPEARVGKLVEPNSQKEQAKEHRQDHHGGRKPPPPPAIDHRRVEIDPGERHAERLRVDR